MPVVYYVPFALNTNIELILLLLATLALILTIRCGRMSRNGYFTLLSVFLIWCSAVGFLDVLATQRVLDLQFYANFRRYSFRSMMAIGFWLNYGIGWWENYRTSLISDVQSHEK